MRVEPVCYIEAIQLLHSKINELHEQWIIDNSPELLDRIDNLSRAIDLISGADSLAFELRRAASRLDREGDK